MVVWYKYPIRINIYSNLPLYIFDCIRFSSDPLCENIFMEIIDGRLVSDDFNSRKPTNQCTSASDCYTASVFWFSFRRKFPFTRRDCNSLICETPKRERLIPQKLIELQIEGGQCDAWHQFSCFHFGKGLIGR